MACYAVLVSVVELLDDIILHNDSPHFRHMATRLPIITSLHQKFSSLEESLRGYASKGHKDAERVEAQIRDAAYTVQHIIESKISKKTKSTYKFLQVLKKAEQNINRIKGELADIQGRQKNENLQPKYDRSSHVHPSEKIPINTTTMVGFDEYLTTIKDQLSGHSPQRQVISIVGTGGLGKTTLARNTFDDALIVEYFDCRAWITVSQEYNAQQVLRSLMKSLGVKELEEGEERELVFKHLKGRRYLIILDDMWDTKVWDDVMHIFPKDDNNGSRIVLTTRLLHIAEYAGTSSDFIHQIQFLNDDDSWDLFQKNVFAQNGCPPELEDIGKSIVNKCGGLPLAIVVIAGVLSNDKTPYSWKEIETNLSAVLRRTDRHFSSMLSFCYNYLRHQLKACFLYMGIFPEDYRIKVSHLIKLWVAEGYLKSTNGSKTLDEVGEECLEDLVARNLVIITKRTPNGQFKYCVLHDLLRDLCRERASDECFFHVLCDGRNHFNPSRMNFYYGHPFEADDNVVHSVHYFYDELNLDFVRKDIFERLRVLQVKEDTVWEDILSNIDIYILRMCRLKFLNIGMDKTSSFVYVDKFALGINLHTIIYEGDGTSLLSEFWKMPQLRHIIVNQFILPPIPMVGDCVPIQKLEHLQTLMQLLDSKFTKEVIKMIPNLRTLHVLYQGPDEDDLRDWYDLDNDLREGHVYGLDNLVNLHRLEELLICGGFEYYFRDFTILKFAFPQTLKVLTLSYCRFPWKCMTMVGSLPNLQELKLMEESFVGEVWEPIEGEFQSLKYLKLDWLDLRHWLAEASHFPCLERLKIKMCEDLEEIPLTIGDIATLKDIKVSSSSKSAGDSAIRIQEEQRELGNDELQVEVQLCDE